LRTLLALASENKWKVHHLDITAAYLEADIDTPVYMEIPEGLPKDSGRVCKLRKSLYGLHQSGRLWNEHLNQFFIEKGFERCKSDPCVYYKQGKEIIVAIYVDDIYLFGVDQEINIVKKDLAERYRIKDLGEITNLLNIRVTKTSEGFELDQEAYAKELLTEFQMENSKRIATPLSLGTKLRKTFPVKELSTEYIAKYQKGIGCLLFLASNTRPDLSFAATYLSQFRKNPSQEHWIAFKHVLRYLRGTMDMRLTYARTGKALQMFTYADWGSDVSDRRSFSGGVSILEGGAVNWYCRKQPSVSLSTSEAELIALSEISKEAIWFKNFMTEIKQLNLLDTPTKLHYR
jgi:hypothetical protein